MVAATYVRYKHGAVTAAAVPLLMIRSSAAASVSRADDPKMRVCAASPNCAVDLKIRVHAASPCCENCEAAEVTCADNLGMRVHL